VKWRTEWLGPGGTFPRLPEDCTQSGADSQGITTAFYLDVIQLVDLIAELAVLAGHVRVRVAKASCGGTSQIRPCWKG
jgi:hypothetical protein